MGERLKSNFAAADLPREPGTGSEAGGWPTLRRSLVLHLLTT